MKRAAALLLCAAMTAGVLSGCAREDEPFVPTGGALYEQWQEETTEPEVTDEKITIPYYPDRSLNPFQCTDHTNRTLLSLLYQGLFAVDQDYRSWPILCESYQVSWDMKTYTFTLANASFSDGTAVTAEDVKESLKKAGKSDAYRGRFSHVDEISVTEDGKVKISLEIPCENLMALLDVPIVKASEVELDQPLGTGPYVFQAGEKPSLQRRTDWWCNAGVPATVSEIHLMTGGTPAQLRDAFEFSGLSMVSTDPGSDTYADFHSDYELWESENGIFLYLACSENSDVFSNDDLRQSLIWSVDRETIVNDVYRGFATATVLPASPNSPCYSTALANRYRYDPMYLAQAVEDNRETAENEVTLLVNSEDGIRLRVANMVANNLQTCGLKVTLLELSGKAYTTALKAGEYDLYLGQTRLSPNMDLTAFFAEDGNLSVGGLSDPVLYALCLDALANSGNYYNLHQRILEDGILCPILFRSYAIYTQRGTFRNLTPSRDNLFFYHLGRTCEEALVDEE